MSCVPSDWWTTSCGLQLNQTDAKRDTGSKLCRFKLARQLRVGSRWVRVVVGLCWRAVPTCSGPRFERTHAPVSPGRPVPVSSRNSRGEPGRQGAGGPRRRGGGELQLGTPRRRSLPPPHVRLRVLALRVAMSHMSHMSVWLSSRVPQLWG
jgi:hypothetical protein